MSYMNNQARVLYSVSSYHYVIECIITVGMSQMRFPASPVIVTYR